MSLGRPPTTTHQQIATVALALFSERGFEETTMEEIAAAVGVGRRTIFRYFPSKTDLVWGEFESVIERLRTHLREGDDLPLMDALRRAAVLSNRYPPEQLQELRQRLTLITTAPALQADSMLRYVAWRGAVAEWAAERLGEARDDLYPETISFAALGASMAAFTRWVNHPDEDLEGLINRAYGLLAGGAVDPEPRGGRR